MTSLPLRCTVRGCDEPLRRCDRTFACPRGHTYDIARSGYVNLLQPQDRKSRHAGDSKDAVEARASLVGAGVGRAILDTFIATARSLELPGAPPVVVDLGSGSGETLARLADARPIAGVGIDLSTAAADFAARRYPPLTWVVANADRGLPLLDGSVALVLSLHARRNPVECRRILDRSGFLLVAVPAADDLVELREAVQGTRVERDRVDELIAEHARAFTPVTRATARAHATLDRAALLHLLRGTYRGGRTREAERVQRLEHLDVTLASDIVLFAPH